MQNQKTIKLLSLFLVYIVTSGFVSRNQSFEKALQKHRKSSLTYIPVVKKGLPYFTSKTLTPTWDQKRGVRIPSFNLRDQDNKLVTEKLFEGRRSVVAFMFTSCAGFCPLLVNKLKQIEKSLPKSQETQFVLISVDPEVDNPETLKNYSKNHGLDESHWKLLTGKKDEIYDLSRRTFASEVRQINSENMRNFAHTEHFYVIDQNLWIRDILNGTRKDMLSQSASTFEKLTKIR